MNTLFLHLDKTHSIPYIEHKNIYFRSTHWGQRKLFLSELYFLSQYGYLSNTVLYVGAAGGNHIPFLMSLFPSHRFIFYDPNPFSFSPTSQCTIYNKCFTYEDALQYSSSQLLFISDIRNLSSSSNIQTNRCLEIEEDMSLQKEWIELIQPLMSMVKFRLNWNKVSTQYFDGEILLQPWAKIRSTETRLITSGKNYKTYDNQLYEECCCYHNEITRNMYTQHSVKKFKQTWDIYAEMQILQFYFTSQSFQYTKATLFELMKQLSKYCGYSSKRLYKY